jgi:hypothetical protein
MSQPLQFFESENRPNLVQQQHTTAYGKDHANFLACIGRRSHSACRAMQHRKQNRSCVTPKPSHSHADPTLSYPCARIKDWQSPRSTEQIAMACISVMASCPAGWWSTPLFLQGKRQRASQLRLRRSCDVAALVRLLTRTAALSKLEPAWASTASVCFIERAFSSSQGRRLLILFSSLLLSTLEVDLLTAAAKKATRCLAKSNNISRSMERLVCTIFGAASNGPALQLTLIKQSTQITLSEPTLAVS